MSEPAFYVMRPSCFMPRGWWVAMRVIVGERDTYRHVIDARGRRRCLRVLRSYLLHQ